MAKDSFNSDFADVQRHQLVGKRNYFDARSHFDRTAKYLDVWGIFNGDDEVISHEPDYSEHLVYIDSPMEMDGHQTRSRAVGPEDKPILDSARSLLKYQTALERYKTSRTKIKLARKLINEFVCEAIRIEIEDIENPAMALDYLVKHYGVSDEVARVQLRMEITKTNLYQFNSITDYVNEHRRLSMALKRAKDPIPDGILITNIIAGLPASYAKFREQWEWDRAKNPETEPDFHFFSDRLLAAEASLEDTRAKDRTNRNRNNRSSDKTCTYPGCAQPIGHTTDNCWTAHPEKKPKFTRTREVKNGDSRDASKDDNQRSSKTDSKTGHQLSAPRRIGAMARGDVGGFVKQLRVAEGRNQALAHSELRQKSVPLALKCNIDGTRPIDTRLDSHPLSPSSDMPSGPHLLSSRDESSTGQGERPECALPSHIVDSNPAQAARSSHFQGELDTTKRKYVPAPKTTCTETTAMFAAARKAELHRDTWLFDSGANMYVCNDKKWFTTLQPVEYTITTCDRSSELRIMGGGICQIPLIGPANEITLLDITDVAYAPEATCNLLSPAMLALKAKLYGEWNGVGMTIKDPRGTPIGFAYQHSGLYHIDCIAPSKEKQVAGFASPAIDLDDQVWRWHRRLGHLGWESMRKLLKMSIGCTLTDEQLRSKLRTICPICAVTKAIVSIPRDPARRRAVDLGELIHVDQWGPYAVPGYNGYRYYLFMTDDAKRFSWCEGYQQQVDAPKVFKAMHKTIENTHNIKILGYRMDGQFQIGEVGDFCARHHLRVEATVPYQHHMAGVIERGMRTMREKSNPMMMEIEVGRRMAQIFTEKTQEFLRNSSIPEILWPAAIEHSVWLRNRAPTRAVDKITPWEAVYGVKPDLSREHVFGSRMFVTLAEEVGRNILPKLHGQRGWLGYFVGCESESVYKIYSEEKHRVFRISMARADDDVGQMDPHDGPSILDRVPLPENLQPAMEMHDDDVASTGHSAPEDEDYEESSLFRDSASDSLHVESPSLPSTHASYDDLDEFRSDDSQNEDLKNIEGLEYAPTILSDPSDDQISQRHNTNWSDTDNTFEQEPANEGNLVEQEEETSRFFANMARLVDTHIPVSSITCRRCCQHGSICRRTDPNEPCTQCSKQKRNCTNDMTGSVTSMKDKIPLKLRDNVATRCGPCTQKSLVCRQHPDDPTKCFYCKTAKRVCRPATADDLARWTDLKLKKRKTKPLEELPASSELRCQACTNHRNFSCNGKTPCNICLRHGRNCKAKFNRDQEKCTGCTNLSIRCDGKRPCSSCVKRKITCGWREQGGLVNRFYGGPHIPPGAAGSARYMNDTRDEDENECLLCKHRNRTCDGGTPCYRCVKHRSHDYCTYLRQGVLKEQYLVTPFVLQDDNVTILDEWEQLAKGKRATRTGVGRNFQKIKYYSSASEDDTDPQVKRRLRVAPVDDDINEFAEKGSARTKLIEEASLQNKQATKEHHQNHDKEPSGDLPQLHPESEKEPSHSTKVIDDPSKPRFVSTRKVGMMAMVPLSSPILSEPQNYGQAMNTPEANQWQLAFDSENDSLEANDVYDIIDKKDVPPGRKILTGRWVCKLKTLFDDENSRYYHKFKARLVARGFQQEEGIDYEETFATVVKAASYKILIAIAAMLGITIYLMDVKTAFLNGDLEQEVFMKPPPGARASKGKVFRLKKALYGLKQAPRAWYAKLATKLKEMGFRASAFDPCIFIHHKELLIVAIWVDDLLIAAQKDNVARVFRNMMSRTFDMKDEGKCSYYLGMNIEQKENGIFVHQRRFAEQALQRFGLENVTPAKSPMDPKTILKKDPNHPSTVTFRQRFQSMVGTLLWLANQTRPDIAFAVGYAARYNANPDQTHMDAVTRIFAYIKSTLDQGIWYAKGSGGARLLAMTKAHNPLAGMSDSDFAGCVDTRKSTTGWIFLLAGGPVSWTSRRQKSNATSTMDAEYMAGSEASKEAVWMRRLINDLNIAGLHIMRVPLAMDNNAALGLTKNPIQHDRAKHIDTKFHFIRERVMEVKDIQTHRVSTKDNVADILTKALPLDQFLSLRYRLGMRPYA